MRPASFLRIEPSESLTFSGSGGPQSTATIQCTNTTNSYVAIKVKTTAPKSYFVRPSLSTINPGETQVLTVFRQESTGSEDRFMIQSVAVAQGGDVPRNSWSLFPKDVIQEHTLTTGKKKGQTSKIPAMSSPRSSSPMSGRDFGMSGGSKRSGSPGRPLLASEVTDQNLKAKYDELVQYTINLEKDKKQLESRVASAEGSGAKGVAVATAVGGVVIAALAGALFYAKKMGLDQKLLEMITAQPDSD